MVGHGRTGTGRCLAPREGSIAGRKASCEPGPIVDWLRAGWVANWAITAVWPFAWRDANAGLEDEPIIASPGYSTCCLSVKRVETSGRCRCGGGRQDSDLEAPAGCKRRALGAGPFCVVDGSGSIDGDCAAPRACRSGSTCDRACGGACYGTSFDARDSEGAAGGAAASWILVVRNVCGRCNRGGCNCGRWICGRWICDRWICDRWICDRWI